jgi:ribosome-binding protein aMBF1 (putative translation factor)
MCKSRKAALAAETRAIKNEHPKYNIRDTPRMKIIEARNYVPIDALKAVREQRALSRAQLSQMSGIDHRRIGAYERGLVRVRPPTAKKLAKALKCRISSLSVTPNYGRPRGIMTMLQEMHADIETMNAGIRASKTG